MRKFLTLAAALVATTATAQFIPVGDIATCQAIENNVQRLSCYDAIDVDSVTETEDQASNEVAVEVETTEPRAPSWTLREGTDAINGTNISRAFVDASRQLSGNDSPEYLMVQCDGEGGFDLFIGTTGFIGSVDRIAVQYRWGDSAPVSERWASSTNGKAAFLPRSYNDFMAGLREGGELAFRWTDFRGNQYSAIWNNIQIDEDAQFVLDGCGQ